MTTTKTPDKKTAPPENEVKNVDPKLIDVAKGFNPRKNFDPAAEKQLLESVQARGVIQSLLVSEGEGGRYNLIAGERRLRAALAANRRTVPVVIQQPSTDTQVDALMENMARRDLNPLEEARAISEILATTSISQKDLAASLSVQPSHITERKRLLTLPVNAQEHIAAGTLPVASSRFLEKVAKASTPIAAHIADILAHKDNEKFRSDPEKVGRQLLRALDERVGQKIGDLPVIEAIYPAGYTLDPRNVKIDWPEDREDLRETWTTYSESYEWHFAIPHPDDGETMTSSTVFQIAPEETYQASIWVLTDREELIAVIEQSVLEWEQQLEKEADEAEKEASAAAKASAAKGEPAKDAKPEPSDHEKREQAKHDAWIANTEIGRNALKSLGTVKVTTPVMKMLALAVLSQNRDMPGAGIALTDERLQTAETIEQKNGKKKHKVDYKDPHEAVEVMQDRILRAKSPEEVLGVLFTGIAAGLTADNEATLVSDRRYWGGGPFRTGYAVGKAEKFIEAEIKKITAKVIPVKKPATKKTPAKKATPASTPNAK